MPLVVLCPVAIGLSLTHELENENLLESIKNKVKIMKMF